MFDNITIHIHLAPATLASTLDSIVNHLSTLKEIIIMNETELVQALADIKAQADKAKAEVIAAVAALEAALASAGTVSPAVEAALADLRGAVQSIDDLNPDAPPGGVVVP